jgi:hypothetical protein
MKRVCFLTNSMGRYHSRMLETSRVHNSEKLEILYHARAVQGKKSTRGKKGAARPRAPR